MHSGTAVIQACLNRFGHALKVDGLAGSKTRQALYSCDEDQELLIDLELLMETGMTINETLVGAGFKTPRYRYLPVDRTNKLIHEILDLMNISAMRKTIEELVALEATAVTVKGVLCYDVLSTNGSSRGLTQMQPPAWEDAAAFLKKADKSLDPGTYRERVYDPAYNLLASIGYALINASWLKKNNILVNAETLYLSHNQGLGFWSGARTNVDGQSLTVQRLIQKYS